MSRTWLPVSTVLTSSLAISLALSCASCAGSQTYGRQTTIAGARSDDPWLTGERCTPDTPATPAPRVEVLAAGTGDPVTPGMTVRIHYVAALANGTVLHDTHEDSTPSEVVLGSTHVICGLERSLAGMRPGEQRRVVIPWALAFGEGGRAPQIPPRADLVFLVDLYLPANMVVDHGAPPANPGAGMRRR
jgi:hypothetical protein